MLECLESSLADLNNITFREFYTDYIVHSLMRCVDNEVHAASSKKQPLRYISSEIDACIGRLSKIVK